MGSFSQDNSTEKRRQPAQRVSSLCIMLSLLSLVLGLTALSPLTSAGTAGSTDFKDRCLSFEPEKLVANAQHMRLEYVTSGTTLKLPDNVASCNRASQVVSTNLCRIALYIATSKRSGISFELWLPEKWSEARYVSTGNGGVDGCKFGTDFQIGHAKQLVINSDYGQASSMRIWHIRLPTASQPWEQIMVITAQLACHSSTTPTLWRTSRIERKGIISSFSDIEACF